MRWLKGPVTRSMFHLQKLRFSAACTSLNSEIGLAGFQIGRNSGQTKVAETWHR